MVRESLCFHTHTHTHTRIRKKTVALNLTAQWRPSTRDLWTRRGKGERGERGVCVMLSEEPSTGPRAGFRPVGAYIHVHLNANVEGIDAWPKDDKSFFRLIVLPPFESFDLAAIERARFQVHFRFLGNWSVRYTSFASALRVHVKLGAGGSSILLSERSVELRRSILRKWFSGI